MDWPGVAGPRDGAATRGNGSPGAIDVVQHDDHPGLGPRSLPVDRRRLIEDMPRATELGLCGREDSNECIGTEPPTSFVRKDLRDRLKQRLLAARKMAWHDRQDRRVQAGRDSIRVRFGDIENPPDGIGFARARGANQRMETTGLIRLERAEDEIHVVERVIRRRDSRHWQ